MHSSEGIIYRDATAVMENKLLPVPPWTPRVVMKHYECVIIHDKSLHNTINVVFIEGVLHAAACVFERPAAGGVTQL